MESRTLDITLQYAKDLNKVNLITKMDVYAVVSISGGPQNSNQRTKTPVNHDGDSNPTWNFSMKFTIDESALQQNRLTLDIKLVCERALGDKDVGEVHVPLKELLDSTAKPGAEGKRFVSYQVRKPSGKPKGQLTFSFRFSDKIAGAASAPPYGSAYPMMPPSGKADGEPVMAFPAGPSSVYPPPAPYHVATEGGGYYPPAAAYAAASGDTKPSVYPPPPPGYGYPPPPPPGYGYPPPPGYGYPPQPGYGYPPVAPARPPKKNNNFGMGLGAGLLGGALGGLLIGDMISDAGDYDSGGFDF